MGGKTSDAMNCDRCHGLLLLEYHVDADADWVGYRCLICGDRIDPVILERRYQATWEQARDGPLHRA